MVWVIFQWNRINSRSWKSVNIFCNLQHGQAIQLARIYDFQQAKRAHTHKSLNFVWFVWKMVVSYAFAITSLLMGNYNHTTNTYFCFVTAWALWMHFHALFKLVGVFCPTHVRCISRREFPVECKRTIHSNRNSIFVGCIFIVDRRI